MRKVCFVFCFFVSFSLGQEKTITLTVPDAAYLRVVEAFAKSYQYPELVPNPAFNSTLPEDPVTNPRQIANPETKAFFTRKMIMQYIREVTISYEMRLASEKAAELQKQKTATEIVIK